LLCVRVCCKLVASQVILQGSREFEVSGCEIRITGSLVHKCIGQSQFQLAVWGPVVPITLDLLKHVAGKQFTADTDVKQAGTFWLQTLDTDFFCARLQVLMPQWSKHLNVSSSCV
jgi:hypothetical protein